jgi:hypothetical protein
MVVGKFVVNGKSVWKFASVALSFAWIVEIGESFVRIVIGYRLSLRVEAYFVKNFGSSLRNADTRSRHCTNLLHGIIGVTGATTKANSRSIKINPKAFTNID